MTLPPEVDQLLREWARWAKRRSWPSLRCGSAEGQYIAELGEVMNDEPRPLPIDARLAWKVELEWRKVEFKARMTLRAAYITAPVAGPPNNPATTASWEQHKRRHCRQHGLHRSEFDVYATRAARQIYNRLRSYMDSYTFPSVSVPPLGRERVTGLRTVAGRRADRETEAPPKSGLCRLCEEMP